MASRIGEILRIPYGGAQVGTLAVELDRRAGAPLRLSDGPYPFAEPPDLVRLTSLADRLAILREHLQSLCGLWDKLAHLFLAAYFARIATAIAANEPELTALAARSGGLFAPPDWSFSALRPLPQAHLGAPPVRVDFAFWTGVALVAIDLQGSGSPRKQRQEELARLREQGVTVVAVPGGALQAEGEALLARLLPAPFQKFWAGVGLPSSPFGPETLAQIRPAD
jgi:hypothetical protein